MLDIDLYTAVRRFLDHLEAQLLHRLEIGEQEYGSRWKDLSIAQLEHERMEEILDAIVYSIFIEEKLRQEAKDLDDEPQV